jgi:glycosyltransferase involved in cell wall biosynthesis
LYQGITPENWFHTEGMKLKHPCVGLVQGAVVFKKTKELLTLTKALQKMPDVTFYWVGDGPYRDSVLPTLQKFDNFKWLGPLEYPNKVRDFLTEIDVYALLSGIDCSPLTLLEAELMEKPVIATNVGGIPEQMKNNETGFLIEKSDHSTLIEKLELLLNDSHQANILGKAGRKFVTSNFSWDVIADNFLNDVKLKIN